MPRGLFEFLLPDALASLSTLGAALPAGKVQGIELGSQIDARNMEQQLRALQMMNEQRKLNAPTWHFQPGLGIPVSPTGEIGSPVTLPVPPKQFAPLKPKELAEQKYLESLTDVGQAQAGKKLIEGQQKNPQSPLAIAASYMNAGIPFEQWNAQVKEWWTKLMTSAPHPVAAILDQASKQGVKSLTPEGKQIYQRWLRGTAQPKNIDYNALRFNLALRSMGKSVSDPNVQKLTPQEAQQTLNKLKQDFLGGLLSGGGLPGSPQSKAQPKTAEDLFKMMDEEGGDDTSSSE